MTKRFHIIHDSIEGQTHKNIGIGNDDYVLVDRINNVFAIADGITLLPENRNLVGNITSRDIAEKSVSLLKENLLKYDLVNETNPLLVLKSIMATVNSLIYNSSYQCIKEEYREYVGTTLSAIKIEDDYIYLLHTGDSSIYLLYKNGNITQITRDFTRAQKDIYDNNYESSFARYDIFGLALTNYIAQPQDKFAFQVDYFPICDVSRILLATDGLTKFVTDEEIKEMMLDEKSFKEKALSYQSNPKGVIKNYQKINNISEEQARDILKYKDDLSFILITIQQYVQI